MRIYDHQGSYTYIIIRATETPRRECIYIFVLNAALHTRAPSPKGPRRVDVYVPSEKEYNK